MSNKIDETVQDLNVALQTGNREAVEILGKDIINRIREEDELPDINTSLELMNNLRNRRYFSQLRDVGDALVQSNETNSTVKRLFAQGLIDSGNLIPPKFILGELIQSLDSSDPEFAEAKGLMGRMHKQIFVSQNNSSSALARSNLNDSINIYDELFQENPIENTWHGINTVALMARADKEKIEIDLDNDYKIRAENILTQIKSNREVSAWDSAIASEAYLALSDGEEALKWFDKFADDKNVSAFHIGSFQRQLKEVWKIDQSTEPGSYLIPKIQHAMLHKEGGQINVEDVRPLSDHAKSMLQKTLGDSGVVEAEWLERLFLNGKSVARIGMSANKGEGTGFLLKGEDIHTNWEGETLLLTNYHVISPTGETRGIFWENAVVTFHDSTKKYHIKEVLWSSPASPCQMGCPNLDHLDVVIMSLDAEPPEFSYFEIGRRLPVVDVGELQRVYVIGHPNGGGLAYSIQDNRLLDHQVPLIHYHSSTEPGSSGSPIFNEDLELIGIHHAGSYTAPLLNDKKNPKTNNTYPANEGIWIQSIIENIKKKMIIEE